MLATIFPGPFDDFRDSPTGSILEEAIIEVENLVAVWGRAISAGAPGLAALAYAAVPSERATVDVLEF